MNTPDKVRIGVIGVGKMGELYLRILGELDGIFEFIGAFDPVIDRCQIAEKYGGKAYHDVEKLLEDVDAVIIACPTSLHRVVAMLAAEKYVHVLCEKPVSESLADAIDMYDAFSSRGLKFTVNHVERFNPVVRTISDIIKGVEIEAVEIHRCSPYDSRIFDVDVATDLMVHDIDIVLNSIFETSPVYIDAFGRSVFGNGTADYSHAVLTFPHGPMAFLTASRCTEDKIRSICIHAKGAYIEGDMLRRTLTVKREVSYEEDGNPKVNYTQSNITQQIVLMDKNPLKEELQNFGRAILYDEELAVRFEHIVRTMTVLDGIEDAMYCGGEI